MTRRPVTPSPEVAAALAEGAPVVALESTIITHGMPWPANLETARAVEAEVRAGGAVPATIAVVEGTLRAGLDEATLEALARGRAVLKASVRDLAVSVARRLTAGTTVAATSRIAAMIGIPVFATGGLGGVHRGVETTWDVSADLVELAHSPTAVVCAGVKSILDIPKTLEMLETWGVPVLGFRTDTFPAFFARSSGQGLDHRVETAEEVAAIIRTQRALGLLGGVLVANPIPEIRALPEAEIGAIIAEACAEAEAQGIAGKALTPFLLDRVNAKSGGRSLEANIALVRNNAALAAEIAAALAAGDRTGRLEVVR